MAPDRAFVVFKTRTGSVASQKIAHHIEILRPRSASVELCRGSLKIVWSMA
jgi:hypothetical protein